MTFIGWNERGPASIDSMWPPVMWLRSAPIAVVAGGGSSARAEPFGGGEAPGDQADRGALDIALAAGDLAGEAQPRLGLEPEPRVEQLWRIQVGVAVDAAEPREFGALESRDHAEDPRLLAVFQLGLEADDVEQRAERVVLPELHDRIGLDGRLMGVGQADRLHRPVAQGLAAALGHHLDRQAAVEIGRALELAELGLLRREQRVDEGLVLVAAHRAVDVGRGALAARALLVVARLHPGDVHVDRVAVDDRRDGVEEGERALAGEARRSRRRAAPEVSGPVAMTTLSQSAGREARDLAALERDERVGQHRALDGGRKAVAVDGERAARRHLVRVGAAA